MYTKFPNLQGYTFYSIQHFTTKLCNFTKFTMLFQDVEIFLPVSDFFKIPSKRLKVYYHKKHEKAAAKALLGFFKSSFK